LTFENLARPEGRLILRGNAQGGLYMSAAYQKALHTAFRILSQRDHSVAELARKLVQRGFEKDVIEAVMSECRRLSYLDDDRFAGGLIRRLKRKGWGPRRIRSEFRRHGLEGQKSDQLLCDAFDAGEELRVACAVAKKKLAADRNPDPRKCRERVYRFLSGRGFSNAVIHEAIQTVYKSS
jgi:regulatory protein